MSVKWYALEVGPVIGTIVAALALMAGLCEPAAAQISMPSAKVTTLPKPKKSAAPVRPSPVTLNAGEQKQLAAAIHHMSRKERKRFAQTWQKMSPQQRRELLVAAKQQMAQSRK